MVSISVDWTWTWWVVLVLAFDISVRLVAVFIVPRYRRPTAAMAWLLAIYFIPFIGILLFLLIGNPRLPRKRRKQQESINDAFRAASSDLDFGTLRPNAPEWFTQLVTLNRNLGALPIAGDNGAQIISDYQDSLDAMAAEIDAAQRYVHVEFYIFQADASTEVMFAALERAAARGVTVRVLLDHWANRWKPNYRKTVARLEKMGADWHLMLPVQPFKGRYQRPDLRNHRKLVVVDGVVGFVGSQNVTDRSYNLKKNIRRGLQWVDLMVRVDGPVVASLAAVFVSDWYGETGEVFVVESDFSTDAGSGDLDCQIVPSGPGFEYENNLKLFLSLIFAAKRKIVMVSPYFVPDEGLLLAIQTACHRGVEVELFVSEEGDQAMVYHAQRSYYEQLLATGVKIWMYKKPYILHSKSMSIDDEVAVVGSSNMDMRSFGLNLEVTMLVRGGEFVEQLRDVEDQYRRMSRELTIEEWERRPIRSVVLDNLARLTSALQ
ncbi:cardiolipin synthase [Microbacterium sp. EYE_5]|uniref:cardiolipin synthase n=1 Tax=unclassified Microbacterium TaxID=2609290 RepID=UPI0020036F48|nr:MULTISPECIES: cardiolipin synthase [unclassified Microbacterium]MCK6079788.1 cardiolipin synthase [Microbacterium sp. EYE_382]MCK6085059.1 cardiolipin synthase [Microbacterium sp. EYE_384]MCK6122715.1 cardiolipin synthase [Microbacterium sp. EYE_80]MCK6125822.1 cardiolipin synthase [Microbacterium sp. EYE_79]MCK6140743.1 cardiolipin synthase [Microbacterium sp. EYE_39]